MSAQEAFYICPTCFDVSETAAVCHHQAMIHCTPDRLNDESCKPLMDQKGRLLTRAPRWFLEAIGMNSE